MKTEIVRMLCAQNHIALLGRMAEHTYSPNMRALLVAGNHQFTASRIYSSDQHISHLGQKPFLVGLHPKARDGSEGEAGAVHQFFHTTDL